MQLQTFDFTAFLFSLLFFLNTCNLSEPVSFHTSTEEGTGIHSTDIGTASESTVGAEGTEHTLNVVLLENNIVFAYEGQSMEGGRFYNYQNIRNAIQKSRNKFGDEHIIVLIKPTKKASYRNTVDALDEMKINNIKEFRINKPSAEEEKLYPAISGAAKG